MADVLEWDHATVNAAYVDKDGFVRLQPDGFGDKGNDGFYSYPPTGLHTCPRDPDVDETGAVRKGCHMFVATEGGTPFAIATTDPRTIAKLPKPKNGGTILFGDTGKGQLPYLSFAGDTGSSTQYIPYAFDGSGQPTKAMAISIDVDQAGQERIQIVHGDGANISFLADKSVNLVAADKGASITVANGGKVTVNGNTTVQGAVLMGNPSIAQPLAMAPELLAYLEQLEIDIAAAISAVGPSGSAAGPPGAAAFVASAAGRAPLKALIAAKLTSGA